jgi:hypothetical protein
LEKDEEEKTYQDGRWQIADGRLMEQRKIIFG